MSYKERLIHFLYGGIYPFFWADECMVEDLDKIANKMGMCGCVFSGPNMIRILLTEEEAKKVLEYIKGVEE